MCGLPLSISKAGQHIFVCLSIIGITKLNLTRNGVGDCLQQISSAEVAERQLTMTVAHTADDFCAILPTLVTNSQFVSVTIRHRSQIERHSTCAALIRKAVFRLILGLDDCLVAIHRKVVIDTIRFCNELGAIRLVNMEAAVTPMYNSSGITTCTDQRNKCIVIMTPANAQGTVGLIDSIHRTGTEEHIR